MKFVRTETSYETKDGYFCLFTSHSKNQEHKWTLVVRQSTEDSEQQKIYEKVALLFKEEKKDFLVSLYYRFYSKKEALLFIKQLYEQLHLDTVDSILVLTHTSWEEKESKSYLIHLLKRGVWKNSNSEVEYPTRKDAVNQTNSILSNDPINKIIFQKLNNELFSYPESSYYKPSYSESSYFCSTCK